MVNGDILVQDVIQPSNIIKHCLSVLLEVALFILPDLIYYLNPEPCYCESFCSFLHSLSSDECCVWEIEIHTQLTTKNSILQTDEILHCFSIKVVAFCAKWQCEFEIFTYVLASTSWSLPLLLYHLLIQIHHHYHCLFIFCFILLYFYFLSTIWKYIPFL